MTNTKGIHLYHILVSQKYEAEDLLRLLKQGQTFFDLAKKFSQCPSAVNSGDLGKINWNHLDENFREAADSLGVGEMTLQPVRTKFGYHLIMKVLKD